MGYQDKRGRKSYIWRLSGYVASFFIVVSFAHAQETDLGAAENEAEFFKYFRTQSAVRPRLGKVLNKLEVGKTGANFEYCDGTLDVVDLKAIIPAYQDCDGLMPSTFRVMLGEAIDLFSNDFEKIGKLYFIAADENRWIFRQNFDGEAAHLFVMEHVHPNNSMSTLPISWAGVYSTDDKLLGVMPVGQQAIASHFFFPDDMDQLCASGLTIDGASAHVSAYLQSLRSVWCDPK